MVQAANPSDAVNQVQGRFHSSAVHWICKPALDSISISHPIGHCGVFEWATEFGQKYVRKQLWSLQREEHWLCSAARFSLHCIREWIRYFRIMCAYVYHSKAYVNKVVGLAYFVKGYLGHISKKLRNTGPDDYWTLLLTSRIDSYFCGFNLL